MAQIHPTALVDPGAVLADEVVIGPYSVVGPHVRIGSGTRVGSHCVIEGHTEIGRDNRIFHHVTLGQEPQDLKYHGEQARLVIGHRNDIREFVTMHIGTENGGGSTTVGSDNMIMIGAHIAHDSHVANHVLIANNVLLAGHITIGDHANLGGGTAVHHYVAIGRYAFIGGASRIVHDCPPFMITDGHPAVVRGVNLIGLARHGFPQPRIDRLKKAYLRLYKRSAGTPQLACLDALQREMPDDELVMELCRFLRAIAASHTGRQAERTRRDDKRRTEPR